jgi:hypothetical protein
MDFVFFAQIYPSCHSGLDPESIVITSPKSPGYSVMLSGSAGIAAKVKK